MNWLLKTKPRNKLLIVMFILLMFAGLTSLAEAGEKVKKGYLGISIERVTSDDKEELDVKFGILITGITKGSAAEEAGLKTDDVIQFYNGERVRKTGVFVDLVRNTKPGTMVKIKLIRNGQQKEVTVKLAEYKSEVWSVLADRGKNFFISFGGGYLGVHLHELNTDLGAYFGVKNGQGALILKVEEDSPAAKSGLRSGDVLTKIDKSDIIEVNNLTEILNGKEEGDEITLTFLRHKKKKVQKVKLGARSLGRGIHILRDLGRRIRIRVPRGDFHGPMKRIKGLDWYRFEDFKEKSKRKLDKAKKKIKEKKVVLKDSVSI